jgi:hypothetical protein
MTNDELYQFAKDFKVFAHLDEDLNLWHIVIDDYTVYIPPAKMDIFTEEDLQSFLARKVAMGLRQGIIKPDIYLN